MRCIFCDTEWGVSSRDGYHHVLPRQFVKILGLTRQDWEKYKDYQVPICGICHDILTELQKPMVLIIKYFSGSHPLQLDITLPTIMSRIDDIRRLRSSNE